nr:receptor-like protein 12 [Ipomoea batatas]
MGTSQMLCFVIHVLLLFSLSLEMATAERREGRALVKWKNTLLLNTHHVLHSWSISNLDNVCWNWTGITCDNTGTVCKIKLDNFGLSAIANISNLVFLNLGGNNLNVSGECNLIEIPSFDLQLVARKYS